MADIVSTEAEKTPFDFEVVKVIVSAERLNFTVDLARVVSEINIYEHIDKPYLTGSIMFNDNANIFNEVNWLGTEKIEITLRTEQSRDFTIKRNFRVVKIQQAVKSNDQNETFLIDFVEEHAFESALKRVQQSYEGHHREIIEQILKDHLEVDLMYEKDKPITGFKKIRAIVPNMTPLEAANWIKDGAPDAFGSPYFLYASLGDERLRFIDLETILRLNPMNQDLPPYIFSQPYGRDTEQTGVTDQSFIIQRYSQTNTEDMLRLVKAGYVGAKWNFFDPFKGNQYQIDHDIEKTFSSMVSRKVFNPKQNDPVYDEDAEFHLNSSREINQIASSRLYTDWEQYKSYHEDEEEFLHKQKVVQKSLRHFLLKSPISINVPGKNFFRRDRNLTIGNIIRTQFQINEDVSGSDFEDKKRSGDYLIYAARHVFTANRYTVNLTCAKMAQRKGVER
jgi:hypothetical protein